MASKLKFYLTAVLIVFSSLLFGDLQKAESLVCIHGFMGSTTHMAFLAKNFKRAGWDVLNWGYSSRSGYIEDHADALVQELIEIAKEKPQKPIHFVTHSMGGLILRATLNHPDCPMEAKIGKAVLIAPPNLGSCWGRYLGQFTVVKKVAKDFSGRELITQDNFAYLGELPPTMQNVLVIAGNLSLNPFIPGENDGLVSVHETVLSTPHEHVVIRRGHLGIVFSKRTYSLAKTFLEQNSLAALN